MFSDQDFWVNEGFGKENALLIVALASAHVAWESYNFFQYFLVSIDFASRKTSCKCIQSSCNISFIISQCIKNKLQFPRSSVGPAKLVILLKFSCIFDNIFYILINSLRQQFPFSFMITLQCILLCFSVTTVRERSSSIFTLSFITALSEFSYSLHFLQGNQDIL